MTRLGNFLTGLGKGPDSWFFSSFPLLVFSGGPAAAKTPKTQRGKKKPQPIWAFNPVNPFLGGCSGAFLKRRNKTRNKTLRTPLLSPRGPHRYIPGGWGTGDHDTGVFGFSPRSHATPTRPKNGCPGPGGRRTKRATKPNKKKKKKGEKREKSPGLAGIPPPPQTPKPPVKPRMAVPYKSGDILPGKLPFPSKVAAAGIEKKGGGGPFRRAPRGG